MKHSPQDKEYMHSRIKATHFREPNERKTNAYLDRCKQLRDSYDYPPQLAREQAFNEDLL